MCTIIVLNQVNGSYPLIIAANRDESYKRTSSPPRLLQKEPFVVYAPRDLERGGTWIGVGQGGWFVGVTNQDLDRRQHDGDKKSRGDIVEKCLRLDNHHDVAVVLSTINQSDYDPFNLVFGRAGAMFLCRVHPDLPVDLEIIHPGISVITNDCSVTQAYAKKAELAREGVIGISTSGDSSAIQDKLWSTLGMHATAHDEPYQSLCVHDEPHLYGTRSSMVMLVDNNGITDYYHKEGHPCKFVGQAPVVRLPSMP